MKNESFDWMQFFAPEKIESVQLESDLHLTADGIKIYRQKIPAKAVFLKKICSQNASGEPQRQLTVLLKSASSAAPGDRITAKSGSFELDSVEDCCDLEGNLILQKCIIK